MTKNQELHSMKRTWNKWSWIFAVLVVSTLLIGCESHVELDSQGATRVEELDPIGSLQACVVWDAPREVGQFDDGGYAFDVQVVGCLAYIADYGDGLEILNITDPTAPTEVGQFDDGGFAIGVQVVGGLAYVADESDGLEILNITDP
ncbi:MAG: LVIVD repeat-containing protein, partial [Promethearchaeota archaeon]